MGNCDACEVTDTDTTAECQTIRRCWSTVETSTATEGRTILRRWNTAEAGVVTDGQTAFRRWSSRESPKREVVPGLRAIFKEAGLASFITAAEAWCMEAGAAVLAEVFEEFEALCHALGCPSPHGFTPAQSRRLHAALLRRSRQGGVGKPGGEEPVLGLRDAMRQAGLDDRLPAAESWCREVGAAFISELLDNLQALCVALGAGVAGGLSLEQQLRLRTSLRLQSRRFGLDLNSNSMSTPCFVVENHPSVDRLSDEEGPQDVGAAHAYNDLPKADCEVFRRTTSMPYTSSMCWNGREPEAKGLQDSAPFAEFARKRRTNSWLTCGPLPSDDLEDDESDEEAVSEQKIGTKRRW